MKLVIAEKPMLARDIARAICGKPVSETEKLPISGNGYTVCACAGHLLKLKEPEEIDSRYNSWNIEDLPIFQDNWKKVAVVDKKKLISKIRDLAYKADVVINAGDPDDEGQLIVDELLDFFGYKGKTLRVYVNDNIEENIRRAFDNLIDNNECRNAGRSAYARQMADMCLGINETRLATKRLHQLLSIGRVQTPTLGLVVSRDVQIARHEKQKYYNLNAIGKIEPKNGSNRKNFEVTLKFEPNKTILSDEKYLFDKEVAEKLKCALEGKIYEISAKTTKKVENPPLPYNLTKLQAEMNKKYKYSAQKTLDITQDLRDKHKAITYNRSDSQYLKDEHYEQAKDVLRVACENVGLKWKLDFNIKSKAFNDKNVTAHHGIIPQEIKQNVNAMTVDERNVYIAIVERYAMQFLPPAEYEICHLEGEVEQGKYKGELKMVLERGFKDVLCEFDTENCSDLPDDGEYFFTTKSVYISEGETKPPKPYTEGTLISDMSSISKYVRDPKIKEILKEKDKDKKGEAGGIGTTATRAGIIETLKKRGYIIEEKGKIKSTQLGREFYALIPADIKNADVTAKWWIMQQDIANGNADVNEIMHDVVNVFNSHKDTAYMNATITYAGNSGSRGTGKTRNFKRKI